MTNLTTVFINPFSAQPLLSISTGILATDAICNDLKSAQEHGKEAMSVFIDERLGDEATKVILRSN